jgi:hypothetical protein
MVLWSEPDSAARERVTGQVEQAVVLDWPGDSQHRFHSSEDSYASIEASSPEEVWGETFELLEGLGYLPHAERGALGAEEQADLLADLKDLGYI